LLKAMECGAITSITNSSTRNKYVVTASNSHGSTQTGVYIAVLPILVDDIKISVDEHQLRNCG
jgi:hypothetical protein